MPVISPTIHTQQNSRELECQRAMEDEFLVFTALAEEAGWSWQEIALAMLELTEQYVAAMRPSSAMEARSMLRSHSKSLH
ncbi:MAG: hypothetical protein KK482_28575 [Sinorhizobium meliloti]|uniref:hypothetical protein n=1 Tax=Sinorhizobium TaxID=28105 RepID=UPI00037A2E6B|nr:MULTISPECIES: hypothetical protein [Sinorhizobium]PND21749.1 hypothetical protein CN934_11290 [Ensifer sp. MMN_5]MCG5487575.1 hypothetical protein [Sinorhizobium meliloti]PND27174.1 hypothetical protein CN933_10690 [Sinorhizobium sp. M4_45]RVQ05283.1 hypothetical protein CN070_01600 [Sinorhizobium meliloti]WEJ12522.1 hypothetical protein N0Q90_28285 [Sinorhizobium sp. M103]